MFWFDASWIWSPSPTSLPARFEFRNYDTYARNYMAGSVTTTNRHHTGDLRGKTIVLQVTLKTNGSPNFVFGGELTGWNTGTRPPAFRVFLTDTDRPFRVAESNVRQLAYWWSSQSVSLDWLAGRSTTLVVDVSKSTWTAAHGQSSLQFRDEFNTFLSNVGQVGIMFGGGRFYDVGVALLPGTGTATFSLDWFLVLDPPGAIAKQVKSPYPKS